MYRQLTLSAILSGGSPTAEQAQLAYGDVVSAWKNYLRRYNDGRGVILIGHSQGSYLLRQLVHDRVDNRKGVRKRLISALLLGGNVTVPEGGNVGGDFQHVPGCRKPDPDRLRGRVLDLQRPGPRGGALRPARQRAHRSGTRRATSSAPTPRRSEAGAPCCAPSIRASRSRRGRRSAPAPRPSGSRARR